MDNLTCGGLVNLTSFLFMDAENPNAPDEEKVIEGEMDTFSFLCKYSPVETT